MKRLSLVSTLKSSFAEEKQRRYELDFSLGETVYDIAERYVVKLPSACRNGVCQICRAELLSGCVEVGGATKMRIECKNSDPPQEIMLCQTQPMSDCKIRVNNVYGPGELPVNKYVCQVISVNVLKGYVYEVVLSLPAGKLPEFFPGQYLALNVADKEEPSFYSIASRPGLRELTLHIQADPHIQSAIEVIEYLQQSQVSGTGVSLTLPYGKACLTKKPEKSLILVAAGTGFAQMKSIIEHLYSQGDDWSISLYWGVRKEEDLYLAEAAEVWAKEKAGFEFYPSIADIDNIDANAHHNQLSDAVLSNHPNLSDSIVFVSGSPKLVYSAMDALVDAGLEEECFYSDVLEYAPRA